MMEMGLGTIEMAAQYRAKADMAAHRSF